MSEALFVTVAETARLLGVSDDLVYDLVHRGELPSATFGSSVESSWRMTCRAAMYRRSILGRG
jgi:excisionase family DNA binding protein